MKKAFDHIRIPLGIIFLIIGIFLLLNWWVSLSVCVTPVETACEIGKYPVLPPLHFFMTSLILIVAGAFLLLFNKFLKITFRSKTISVVCIIFILAIIGLKVSIDFYPEPTKFGPYAKIWFDVDEVNKILTVNKCEFYCGEESDYVWENIVFDEYYGNATLPTGPIKKGDTIVNCSGRITLAWLPRQMVIYVYNFN